MAEEEKKNPAININQEHTAATTADHEKKSWPEVVGLSGEDAEKKVKQDMPLTSTFVIPEGSFVTMDFRTDRVRIFVDSAGKVVRTPFIG